MDNVSSGFVLARDEAALSVIPDPLEGPGALSGCSSTAQRIAVTGHELKLHLRMFELVELVKHPPVY
jgi:hypothetical protein